MRIKSRLVVKGYTQVGGNLRYLWLVNWTSFLVFKSSKLMEGRLDYQSKYVNDLWTLVWRKQNQSRHIWPQMDILILIRKNLDPRHFKNGYDQLSYVSGTIANIHEEETQVETQRKISNGSSRVSFLGTADRPRGHRWTVRSSRQSAWEDADCPQLFL